MNLELPYLEMQKRAKEMSFKLTFFLLFFFESFCHSFPIWGISTLSNHIYFIHRVWKFSKHNFSDLMVLVIINLISSEKQFHLKISIYFLIYMLQINTFSLL